jgi:hypothetical protein
MKATPMKLLGTCNLLKQFIVIQTGQPGMRRISDGRFAAWQMEHNERVNDTIRTTLNVLQIRGKRLEYP